MLFPNLDIAKQAVLSEVPLLIVTSGARLPLVQDAEEGAAYDGLEDDPGEGESAGEGGHAWHHAHELHSNQQCQCLLLLPTLLARADGSTARNLVLRRR